MFIGEENPAFGGNDILLNSIDYHWDEPADHASTQQVCDDFRLTPRHCLTYSQIRLKILGKPVEMRVITKQKIRSVLGSDFLSQLEQLQPTPQDERWRAIPWMTNIMAARRRSAKEKLPILMWIMVGNPQGCT